jgi:DNA modification methylase
MTDISHLLGKVHNCDCLEFMKQLPDKCVDLVLTDPPYGIGFDGENVSMSCGMRKNGSQRVCNKWSAPKAKGYERKEWDSEPPKQEIFDEIFRVSKKQIIWGGNYFDLPQSGGWLVWDKGVVMPTLSKCELAWTGFMGHIEIIHYLWAGFLKAKPEEREHPTQKPVEVIGWAAGFAPDGIVFDPFMGSGTTAVACERLGRKWFGCELEPKYCEIANKRIEAERSQLKLF